LVAARDVLNAWKNESTSGFTILLCRDFLTILELIEKVTTFFRHATLSFLIALMLFTMYTQAGSNEGPVRRRCHGVSLIDAPS
jgi:hypothetical protein